MLTRDPIFSSLVGHIHIQERQLNEKWQCLPRLCKDFFFLQKTTNRGILYSKMNNAISKWKQGCPSHGLLRDWPQQRDVGLSFSKSGLCFYFYLHTAALFVPPSRCPPLRSLPRTTPIEMNGCTRLRRNAWFSLTNNSGIALIATDCCSDGGVSLHGPFVRRHANYWRPLGQITS